MTAQKTLLVGMDAGGTKTRLAFKFSDAPAPRYAEGPGINFKRDGLEKSITSCVQQIKDACKDDLIGHHLVLCAGIAGIGRPQDRTVLTSRLEHAFTSPESVQISVLTDADVAYYAAYGKESGILIIIGTGSILLAKTRDGQFVRAGGWGYLLGDEAGGFRLAQAGLGAVANALDGGPSTLLQELLEAESGVTTNDALIEFVYNKDTVIQRFAVLVVKAAEEGDAVALYLIDTQLTHLAGRLSWLLGRHLNIEKEIKTIGGLSQNAFYLERLIRKINAVHPKIRFSKPLYQPVDAALELSRQGSLRIPNSA